MFSLILIWIFHMRSWNLGSHQISQETKEFFTKRLFERERKMKVSAELFYAYYAIGICWAFMFVWLVDILYGEEYERKASKKH